MNSSASGEEPKNFLIFIAGAIGVILTGVLLPALVLAVLMSLTWMGSLAMSDDNEVNWSGFLEVLILTAFAWIYFFGVSASHPLLRGVLFTDLAEITFSTMYWMISEALSLFPFIHKVFKPSESALRLYFWFVPCIAGVITGVGVISKRLRGQFIYFIAVGPFYFARSLATNIRNLLIFAFGLWMLILLTGMPPWAHNFIELLLFAACVANFFEGTLALGLRSLAENSPRALSENIELGSERDSIFRKRAWLTEAQLNHHVQIVGASGFGKSVLLSHIIDHRIQLKKGLLFIDLKADLETVKTVRSNAEAANRKDDLFVFSTSHPELSSSYNILAEGSATELRDRVMTALTWSEEYYKSVSGSFLLRLFNGLVKLRDSAGFSLDLHVVYRATYDADFVGALANQITDLDSPKRHTLEDLAQSLTEKEFRNALAGLKSQLESLVLSDFGHLLKAGDGINLYTAIREEKLIYLLLDSRSYGETSKALGKLIIQDLKAASSRIDREVSKEDRRPFTVVIDEFADLATEDFIGFLDRARSSKIGVVVAHQEVADLDRVSPEFKKRLMNSTSTLFAFLQKLPESSEMIAAICGTKKTEEFTERMESTLFLGSNRTGDKSVKVVDEFIIHPNVIRSLRVGECVRVSKYPCSTAQVLRIRSQGAGAKAIPETGPASVMSTTIPSWD